MSNKDLSVKKVEVKEARSAPEDYDAASMEKRSKETAPARAKRYVKVLRAMEREMTEGEWNGC